MRQQCIRLVWTPNRCTPDTQANTTPHNQSNLEPSSKHLKIYTKQPRSARRCYLNMVHMYVCVYVCWHLTTHLYNITKTTTYIQTSGEYRTQHPVSAMLILYACYTAPSSSVAFCLQLRKNIYTQQRRVLPVPQEWRYYIPASGVLTARMCVWRARLCSSFIFRLN